TRACVNLQPSQAMILEGAAGGGADGGLRFLGQAAQAAGGGFAHEAVGVVEGFGQCAHAVGRGGAAGGEGGQAALAPVAGGQRVIDLCVQRRQRARRQRLQGGQADLQAR